MSKGKIYCIMGKSGSGKDTVFKELIKMTAFKPVITYTTRPKRVNEADGADYFFIDHDKLSEFRKAGRVIEERSYNTVQGVWHYAAIDDGRTDLTCGSYLLITTLEAYRRIVSYFGEDNVVPVYIEVEDGLRLERALMRERREVSPDYAELCRRFLADCEDFSKDKLEAAGIRKYYYNFELDMCVNDIMSDIFVDD